MSTKNYITVKAQHSIPQHITDLTHLSQKDVQDAPSFVAVIPTLSKWIEDHTSKDSQYAVFIAHFNQRILQLNMEKVGVHLPANWIFADSRMVMNKLAKKSG